MIDEDRALLIGIVAFLVFMAILTMLSDGLHEHDHQRELENHNQREERTWTQVGILRK